MSLLLAAYLLGCTVASISPLLVTGDNLSVEDVAQVARERRPVVVAGATYDRMMRAHQVLLAAAKQHMTVYGLTRGVGVDKDKVVLDASLVDVEANARSADFNARLLAAHQTSVGAEVAEDVVRATLLARLNGLVRGTAGVQPEVVRMLVAFLNHGIHPVLHSTGSVGEADIAILPSVGLAMLGQGTVHYKGVPTPAAQALSAIHLEPLRLVGKDGLAIIGSNAYSAGLGALVLTDLDHLLEQMIRVYCMSLEALDGNVAPLLDGVQRLRPFVYQQGVARRALQFLRGSNLFRLSSHRALQDPLSFRTATQVLGAAEEMLNATREALELQLNSADDNPAVLLNADLGVDPGPQLQAFYVDDGHSSAAIIPTGNFEPISWVLKFEALAIALSHVSRNSAARMIVLTNPNFTGLPRNLSANRDAIAYGMMQMAFLDFDNQIRALSNPTSVDFLPAAGGIEDHATNAPRVVTRVQRMVEYLRYITGMELLHAAQAIDLRRRANPKLALGADVAELHRRLREVIPFLEKDRVVADDIERVNLLLRDAALSPPNAPALQSEASETRDF